MPEWFSACRSTIDVDAVPGFPRLCPFPSLDPGIAIELNLRRCQPIVTAMRSHVRYGTRNAVRGNQALAVDRPNRVDAPLHLLVEVLTLELQPVDALRIGCHLDGGLDIVPF